ncbi:MAG: ABC transporter substrate-binding protein [Legionella sp.]|nr:ABC transporter substrate-binding protein [Legionella sp.]
MISKERLQNNMSRRGLTRRLVLTAALLASVSFLGQAQAADPIKLGILPSTTGPGASLGSALTLGVEVAVNEINKAGGVNGRQLQLVRGDTQSNPTTATSEAKRLIEREKIELLIGPLVSQEVVPTVAVATPGKVLQFTNAGTTALNPQNGPYHFSLNTSSATVAEAMLNYVSQQMKDATIGILADDGGQSRTGVAAVKEILAKRNMKLAGEQEFRMRTDDMTSQVLSLKRANPTVVLVLFSFVEDGVKILNTLRDVSWQPKVVGATAMTIYAGAIAPNVDKNAFDNVVGMAYKGLTYCTGEAEGKSLFAEFGDKMKAHSPSTVGKVSVSLASEYYDAVKLIEAGIKATGGTDGAKLAKWMETDAKKVKLIHGSVSPTAESHFMFGPDEIAPVERPQQTRSDGLMKRSGC